MVVMSPAEVATLSFSKMTFLHITVLGIESSNRVKYT